MKSTRIFAILLAVFMLLTLVPVTAFADAYTLTVDENIEHGTVSTVPNLEEIESGTEIALSVAPEWGYEIDEITVSDEEGNDLKEETEFKKVEDAAEENTENGEACGAGEDLTERYTFIMPEKNVFVSAAFKEAETKYTITLEENIENGSAEIDVNEAFAEDTVTITLTPDEGYITDIISVSDSGDNEVEHSKVSSNVYTFKMPASDVTVSVSFKEKSDVHAITIDSGIKKGKITASRKEAQTGAKIQITSEPNENYMLDELTVLDDDNNEIEITQKNSNTYEFDMPDSDVTINATFADLPVYDVIIESGIKHGSLKTDLKEAHEGDKVTITITPYTDYTLKSITVLDEDDDEVNVSGTGSTKRTFRMPASKVYISAVFKSDPASSGSKTSTSAKTSTGSVTTPVSNTATKPADSKALPFKDVADTDWFAEDVRYAYENNLMKGITDDTFAPLTDITRAMIVTILYRMEGEPEVYTVNPFIDVADDAWYANAVKWASGFGIVKGMSDTEFAPDATITREQFAAILYRYAQYKGFDTEEEADISGYEDEAEIKEYAVKPIKWAVAKSFINGMTTTSLAPRGNASRAQASAILHRIKNAIK